jgi:hypothetical protein
VNTDLFGALQPAPAVKQPITRRAVFSPCGLYRYELSRLWDASLPTMVRIGLNPSRAGAEVDDQTARKDVGFAQRLGCGSVLAGNLYGYIATDPDDLRAAGHPVGPDNDAHLVRMCTTPGAVVVCAWGGEAHGLPRVAEVHALLRRLSVATWALRINKDGTPAHLLYLPYTCQLQTYQL